MSEVHSVTVQIYPPDEKTGYPGQVTTGYYRIDGDLLIMTDMNGVALFKADGSPFEYKLGPGENARARAAILTREVRRHLRGDTEAQERFRRRIDYRNTGIA